ncbi:hypothetical protein niasHS_014343 [Heterodera schachtii]|uniref:Uncharacterized protein n=1 Tax=Heterodera schachtii TaxID=97005 RepID=A0ABD2INN2_HETSC
MPSKEELFKKPAEHFLTAVAVFDPQGFFRASFCFYMFHHHHHGTRPAVPGSSKQKWQLGEVALIVVLHLLSPHPAPNVLCVCVCVCPINLRAPDEA